MAVFFTRMLAKNTAISENSIYRNKVTLPDSQDRNVVLSVYYDMEENDYKSADRSPEGTTNADDHCVSTTVLDWDNDGDFDLLLGAKEGRLYLQENQGTAQEASFSGVNQLLKSGEDDFMIPGGLTAARPFDWDSDGDKDLVCGSFEGGLYFVENTGADGSFAFAKPVVIEPELLRSYGTRSVAHSGGKKRAEGSDLSWPPGGPGKNHKKWLVPVLARVL